MTLEQIYFTATKHLGEPLALDRSVPKDVRCAQAVSWIIKEAGHPDMPASGISTVNGLIAWMLEHMQETHQYVTGAIITAHQPDPHNPNFAHAGVCFNYGIGSNNSPDGLFLENYTKNHWEMFFTRNHGSITRYFIPKI